MSEKVKQKSLEKRNIIIYSFFVILIGTVLLVALYIYQYHVTVNKIANVSKIQQQNIIINSGLYDGVVQPIVYNIGIILIVLGTGTLLFELFGYLSYFRKRIAEVFTELDIIKLLGVEYKKKLKYNLTKDLYKPNTEDGQEILNLFDERIGGVLKDYYYSKYSLHIECDILNEKYIKKTIQKNVVLKEVNKDNKNYIQHIINVLTPQIEEEICPFKIEQIKLNDKVLTENDYSYNESFEENSSYSKIYLVSLNEKHEIKNELKLTIKYTTIVPIEDKTYTLMIDRLCKDLRAKFCFDNRKISVHGTGFKFSIKEEDGFSNTNYQSVTEIESNGWVLPGEGICFSIFQKND